MKYEGTLARTQDQVDAAWGKSIAAILAWSIIVSVAKPINRFITVLEQGRICRSG